MKTLLLLLALVLGLYLARDKARSARLLMTNPNYPEAQLNPTQLVFKPDLAVLNL